LNTELQEKLSHAGYSFDSGAKIWKTRNFQEISYSDGNEIEDRILEIVRTVPDVSTLSEDLRSFCTDWPSTYHLSQLRSNLLRPFISDLTGDVLELGAGCGAITRYLGETANSVVAVEGSLRRCQINAVRMRGLDNVEVVASEVSDFCPDISFDTVVIVGVLEYAGLFVKSRQPHLEFLKQAKSFLKPGGKLLLAIENKMGLKYFAGAPEHHVSIPMFGIENRYDTQGVMTFSKTELTDLLQLAGFTTSYFHAPVPDHKLTRAVVSERGMKTRGSIPKELFQQTAYTDRQLPDNLNFSLWRAWDSVDSAGLLDEFTNSFIVESSTGQSESSLGNAHAYYYGTPRVSEYCLEKIFYDNDRQGNLRVTTSKIKNLHGNLKAFLTQNYLADEHYLEGPSLSDTFMSVFSEKDWGQSEFIKFMELYINSCKSWCLKSGVDWPETDLLEHRFPGKIIDLIPRNMKVDEAGNVAAFDLEWETEENLGLGYLLFRAILDLSSFLPRERWKGPSPALSRRDLMVITLVHFGVEASKIEEYAQKELRFQRQVGGEAVNLADYLEFLKAPLVRSDGDIDAQGNEIETLKNEIETLKNEISRGEYREAMLEASLERKLQTEEELAGLQNQLNAAHKHLDALLATVSWRATKPLRVIRRILARIKRGCRSV
jgi:precorrin-6B methylase 2